MTRRDAEGALERLAVLWRREQQATQARFESTQRVFGLRQRVAMGTALRGLVIDEVTTSAGARLTLWLRSEAPEGLSQLALSSGDPVVLWRDAPDESEALSAVVSRREETRLAVIVHDDPGDRLDEEGFRLDLDAPRTTFERGRMAIERFQRAERGSDRARLRDVLLGEREGTFDESKGLERFFDDALNAPQREAVRHALAAEDVALIHGPPGTGKTRTLVELIRQSVARGESVLATAASNTAVDNLAERLVLAGLDVIRLGHPARISQALATCTLDAKLEATETYALTRRWVEEANAIRRRVAAKTARGRLGWAERRAALDQAYGLLRDARKQMRGAQDALLDRADVLCATAAGSDTRLLGRGRRFDRVVIDEATQVTNPIALVPIKRADRVVMAGDPRQLPPTVIDVEAAREGLAVTFFEALIEGGGASLCRLLTVQHRMHETLMAFPSESMYEGRLEAAPGVATHRLESLDGVSADPLRAGPLVFINTAGKGWGEDRVSEGASCSNLLQAERTVLEVRRLLARGVAARDIAVITPYRAQVNALRERLAGALNEGLEVNTVDGFQGREREAVVVDLVRSNDEGALGFLEDTRRMNVALTRARRFLLVVGDSATLGRHPYYAGFLDGVEYAEGWLSAWDDDGFSDMEGGG